MLKKNEEMLNNEIFQSNEQINFIKNKKILGQDLYNKAYEKIQKEI